MTEQPEQPATDPTSDVDEVASVANLFDGGTSTSDGDDSDPADASPRTVPPNGDPRDDEPRDDDPRDGEPSVDGDSPDADASFDGGDADDAGPDWEQLAADDPRTAGEVFAELALVSASRDDYLDALQRKQAEFENFRRRMQGQAAGQRVAGHADVAGRVLEVLDDFDRTLASIAATTDEGVVKGVTLVRDKLVGALREVGLERVDDQGAHFDPNRHEAVQQVPGDGLVGDDGEPVVAEVLRPGYVLGDRVLRAAMVAVAQ